MQHIRLAALAASALIVPSALARSHASVRADATTDPVALFAQINTTLAEMRAKHAAEIAARVSPEALEASIAPMNEHITNLENSMLAIQRSLDANNITPNVIGDMPATSPEYVAAFKGFMRAGEDGRPDIRAALQIGSAPDGGYLAPVEWDRSITEEVRQESPIRAHSDTITISGPGFSRLWASGAPGSGWVGETAARPQTTTPIFTPLTFGVGEIYANPAITQQALDDVAIDLEGWLGGQVRQEFSRQENIAFLSGDGTNKPKGLLTYVTGGANAATHPEGAIEIAAAPVGGVNPDSLLNMLYGFQTEFVTPNSKWFMNRLTIGAVRLLKDVDGQFIWQPGLQAGEPSALLTHPIVEVPGLPLPGAGNILALFGDMRRTYLVIDRIGIRVLRDPYTNKPYVMFYTTKRVGGGVQNPQFMKALKQNAV